MPSRTRPWLPSVVSLLLVGSAAAQRPVVAVESDQQLLRDLGDDERCLAAERTLARRGGAAVAMLMAAIRDPEFRADGKRLANAVFVLGKIGDAAVPAVPLLLQELPATDDALARNLFWALGEIGPKADAGGGKVLEQLVRRKPQPGWSHQEWAFACRRIELGTDLDRDDLAALLQRDDHASLVAAADLLCRLPAGSAAVPPDALLAAWRRIYSQWPQNGDGWSRVTLELARAVVRHGSEPMDQDEARAALVRHFDVEVRLDAVMQLGQTPELVPERVVQALRRALADGSVLVRREAVTALGMVGAVAADAVPALTAMCNDADAQTRARAAAALRAIAGKAK